MPDTYDWDIAADQLPQTAASRVANEATARVTSLSGADAETAARALLVETAALVYAGTLGSDNLDLSGTLDVTGAATFDSTADVVGNMTVGGDLDVTGTATLGAIAFDNLDLTGTLDVTEATTLDDDLTVAGTTTLSGTTYSKATAAAKTANYTITLTDDVIDVDATSDNVVITLPAVATSGLTGRVFEIRKVDASPNTVTVDGDGSETLNGGATVVLSNRYDAVGVRARATEWVY
jgi:hypothetical protein